MTIAAVGTVGAVGTVIHLKGSAPGPPPHAAVKELLIGDRPTGYAYTKEGVLHRPSQTTCPSLLPRSQPIVSGRERRRLRLPPHAVPPELGEDGCRFDRDCTQFPNGYCVETLPAGNTHCAYGCVGDSECPDGICLCDEPVGRCVHASCRVDRNCAPGLCAIYSPSPGCWSADGFACQSPLDECRTDSDCDPNYCGWNAETRRRVCTSMRCMY